MELHRYWGLSLILAAPLIGAWCYEREYRVHTDARKVEIADLHTRPPSDVQQCVLKGFAIPEQEPVQLGQYEYLRVTAEYDATAEDDANSTAPSIVLRRQISLDGSLRDRVAVGVVEGRYDPEITLGEVTVERLEQAFPMHDASVGRLVIDVDREYLSQIAWISGAMTIYVAVMVVVVSGWFRRRHQTKIQRHDRTRCEVALELALSQQEVF